MMCGAIQGGLSLNGVNVAKEAIIQGQVLRVDASGSPGRERLRAPARPHR